MIPNVAEPVQLAVYSYQVSGSAWEIAVVGQVDSVPEKVDPRFETLFAPLTSATDCAHSSFIGCAKSVDDVRRAQTTRAHGRARMRRAGWRRPPERGETDVRVMVQLDSVDHPVRDRVE